jgi:hypothetical protein
MAASDVACTMFAGVCAMSYLCDGLMEERLVFRWWVRWFSKMGVLACEILVLAMVLVPTGAHLDSDLTCLPTIVEPGEGSARSGQGPPDCREATPMQMSLPRTCM